jgi:hypothetical protein
LRNQFRALDEDEAAFLDNVLESTRAKEADVKKETNEQLQAFRKQQEDAEKATRLGPAPTPTDTVETSWTTSVRKRKKGRSEVLGGVKLRKTSSTDVAARADDEDAASQEQDASSPQDNAPHTKEVYQRAVNHTDTAQPPIKPDIKVLQANAEPPAEALLGLGAYSSDEDEADQTTQS